MKEWKRNCPNCGIVIVYKSKSSITRAIKDRSKCFTCYHKCQFTPEQRFWIKVDKNGPIPQHMPQLGNCWIWKGSKLPKGYGQFVITNRSTVKAHRFAYEIENGPIPKGRLCCHHCDRPDCVRSEHLFLGTDKDNIQDCVNKNRRFSKLTKKNVLFIRNFPQFRGITIVLSKQFNVSPSLIGLIINNRCWKHLLN